jgi:mRNA-degrading endonuclease RelE of RelBE toxin-antitoxin system
LAWTIDYSETARRQLRKLDKVVARRILDFLDKRVAKEDDPRSLGKALTGRWVLFGATASGIIVPFAKFVIGQSLV